MDDVILLNAVHRMVLRSSQQPRYLHSAILIGRLMLVFGGNTHNDTSVSHGAKCYSSFFMAYDIGLLPLMNLSIPVQLVVSVIVEYCTHHSFVAQHDFIMCMIS